MKSRFGAVAEHALWVLGLMTAIGCGSDPAPGPGATAAGAGAPAAGMGAPAAGMGAAGGGAPAATFTQVYAMLFPRSSSGQCEMCHGLPAHDVVNGNLETGMSQDTAYAALVGKTSTSTRCMSRPLVVAGKPDESLLYLKLSPTPPCGVRMPNGGSGLSAAQIEMVRSWIAAGAKKE
jgi:hypothetical protein